MGKRKAVIVLSSSEDDEVRDRSAGGHQRPSKSRSNPLSTSRKRIGKRSKETSCVGSVSRPSPKFEAAKFATLSEDFSDCLEDLHLARGNQYWKELWIDKYKPSSVAQLAVHKKKVEEIKCWLEDRLTKSKGRSGNVLLLTGHAGIGKSATVRAIASQLGAQLCEWTTPTPTLWQEHVHISNLGLRYVSKLDEFESFVEKVGKYSLLFPNNFGLSKVPIIILIDDLPGTNGRAAFVKLKKCLMTLAHSSQLPTIISITEFSEIDLGKGSTSRYEELISILERAGAQKVAFNPLTVSSIKKVLSNICQEEKCDVTLELIDQIAKTCGGDIRNAVASFQYCCVRPDDFLLSASSTQMTTNTRLDFTKSRSSLLTGQNGHEPLSFFLVGRDETLTLFHALGKFLHNKREIPNALDLDLGSESLVLCKKFVRKPLKMDVPERVLSQAYGQARPVVDFLHENVLDFVSDGAINDAWMVSSYLSDADCLLALSLHIIFPSLTDMHESKSISQLVAASVAVRGVLFGNVQPMSSRWHTIRSPKLWQIEHLAHQHKNELMGAKCDTYGIGVSMSEIVTEYLPSVKWISSGITDGLGDGKYEHYPIRVNSSSEHGFVVYDSKESMSNEESDDDEIEDW
ncbi:hypothetical protein HPP92_021851 [Vanilla planifolia]|uniref:Cell cycle checkpoint protein RAD17 n=1 Tax=Vanilla planifolia TaxID=51239 RepID=A0A835UEW1_VANPL|nr:hypothetical protein HPP92_021851 [Vanilla planifolia]